MIWKKIIVVVFIMFWPLKNMKFHFRLGLKAQGLVPGTSQTYFSFLLSQSSLEPLISLDLVSTKLFVLGLEFIDTIVCILFSQPVLWDIPKSFVTTPCFEVTAWLVPLWFRAQLEVKSHNFRWLERSEKTTISRFFLISISQSQEKFSQANKTKYLSCTV